MTNIIEERRRAFEALTSAKHGMSGEPALRRRSDIFLPPECRELIERGALVAVSSSGGKDSQAMTILLSRIVPREQLLVVHAPLGEVEWQGTLAHLENTMPPGVPLILARVASGKSLLERVEERGKWPDSARRWCTSDFKVTPIERELRRFLKSHPRFEGRLVSAMGLRRDESAARAKRVPWKRNDRNSRVSGQSEPYLSRGFQCEGGSWLWCPRAEGKGS